MLCFVVVHPLIQSLLSSDLSFVSETVVVVSVLILVALFSVQQYGTDKVAWLFAPYCVSLVSLNRRHRVIQHL